MVMRMLEGVLNQASRTILDADLAALYGVTTKRLNEQVKRNRDRFPEDFMFRLTAPELQSLDRLQYATGSQHHRDPRFTPYAFTEHGAIMAATLSEFWMPFANSWPSRRPRPSPSAAESASCRTTTDPESAMQSQPLNTRGTIDTLDCCHLLGNITAGSGFQVKLLPTVAARGDDCVTDPIYSIRHRVCAISGLEAVELPNSSSIEQAW